MRALVITAVREAHVQEVDPPVAAPGEVVVDVAFAGICGTDLEFFSGEMQYLHDGHAAYPVRIGHEWSGRVSAVGRGVDPAWIGRRVTGDTMLGCGSCPRCATGFHHVCEARTELGLRGGRPGALAEQVALPVRALHRLPDTVDDGAGAMVEPGANAFRSIDATHAGPGDRVLVMGTGTIGLLCAMFARARGARVDLLGRRPQSLEFARSLGFERVWDEHDLPAGHWDAVVDASNAPGLPARAVDLVEPGRRVVYVGLAGSPSMLDTRRLALSDVTAVGILGGSRGIQGTIDAYGRGDVDPRPLVGARVSLEELPAILGGAAPDGAGPGPKVLVDVRSPRSGVAP